MKMNIGGTGPSAVHMPLHLYMMFKPLPMPPYLPPVDRHLYLRNYQIKREKQLDNKSKSLIKGIGSFMSMFNTADNAHSHENASTSNNNIDDNNQFDRSDLLKKDISILPLAGKRLEQYKKENHRRIEEEELKKWNPHDASDNVTKNAFNTLFISNLSPNTTEEILRNVVEKHGKVLHIRVVRNKKGKSRRYAFIEFEEEQSLHAAFKDLKNPENSTIDGYQVIVDVERGRTVSNWKPRRLGGGPPRSAVRSSYAASSSASTSKSSRYHDDQPSSKQSSSFMSSSNVTATSKPIIESNPPSASMASVPKTLPVPQGAFAASSTRDMDHRSRARSQERRRDGIGSNGYRDRDKGGARKRDRSQDSRRRDRSQDRRGRGSGDGGWERRGGSDPKRKRSRSRPRQRR